MQVVQQVKSASKACVSPDAAAIPIVQANKNATCDSSNVSNVPTAANVSMAVFVTATSVCLAWSILNVHPVPCVKQADVHRDFVAPTKIAPPVKFVTIENAKVAQKINNVIPAKFAKTTSVSPVVCRTEIAALARSVTPQHAVVRDVSKTAIVSEVCCVKTKFAINVEVIKNATRAISVSGVSVYRASVFAREIVSMEKFAEVCFASHAAMTGNALHPNCV